MLRRPIHWSAVVLWVVGVIGAHAEEPATKSLFDGKSLVGWKNPYEWGKAEIVNGEIHLTADKKFFLVTEKTFHDFEFEGELRLPEGTANSGFVARGQVEPNRVFGYQAEADPTERRWSGGLYDEGRRQWLNPLWKRPDAQVAFDRNRWNRYRVRCVGTHLQFFVNDVPTTDYFDPLDLGGCIGLQHHGEAGQTYRFRNLKVRDLGRHEWVPLFDGKSLEGWSPVGGGRWAVVDGMLRGTASQEANEPNGLLATMRKFVDGTYRIEYRCVRGDSGFFVRSTLTPNNPFIKGLQCEIDMSEDIGGLYQTGGKGWLVRPLHYLATQYPEDRRAVVLKRWKLARQNDVTPAKSTAPEAETTPPPVTDEASSPWHTMVIDVHGNRIVTHLNGCLASDFVVDDLPAEGVLALQLHGKQDLQVDFRRIDMLQPVEASTSENP